MASIYLIYYAILMTASVLLIVSTKKRVYQRMMPFMVMMGIGCVLAFLQIISSGLIGILYGLIIAGFNIYFLVCVHSLYQKLKNEAMGPAPVPFQTTVMTYPNQSAPYPQPQHMNVHPPAPFYFQQNEQVPAPDYDQSSNGVQPSYQQILADEKKI